MIRERREQVLLDRGEREVQRAVDAPEADGDASSESSQVELSLRPFCPVPLTVRGTQALVSFAPLAFKLFYAAHQNAVLRRSPFPPP